MTQKYIVLNNENNKYEYDIFVETKGSTIITSLHYSDETQWSNKVKGSKILEIVDNGDTITLDRKIKTLHYHEFTELRILLSFKHIINQGLERYTIMEYKELMNI